jgi:hypothetical protein
MITDVKPVLGHRFLGGDEGKRNKYKEASRSFFPPSHCWNYYSVHVSFFLLTHPSCRSVWNYVSMMFGPLEAPRYVSLPRESMKTDGLLLAAQRTQLGASCFPAR